MTECKCTSAFSSSTVDPIRIIKHIWAKPVSHTGMTKVAHSGFEHVSCVIHLTRITETPFEPHSNGCLNISEENSPSFCPASQTHLRMTEAGRGVIFQLL